jgi:hypothetical protein
MEVELGLGIESEEKVGRRTGTDLLAVYRPPDLIAEWDGDFIHDL